MKSLIKETFSREKKTIKANQKNGKKYTKKTCVDQLWELYKNAAIICFSSLKEVFSFPKGGVFRSNPKFCCLNIQKCWGAFVPEYWINKNAQSAWKFQKFGI